MSENLITVDGLSKKFCRSLKRSLWYGVQDLSSEFFGRSSSRGNALRYDEFWASNDISFELRRGECLGLVGRNGAGKTTLLRMLNGLIKPDRGRIELRGRVGALIALGAGFNPILTGRENIYINASILGISKSEIDQSIDGIVEFAELNEFIDAPVQSYSSGMQVRLGFSIATTLKPDVLLLDEVLAVGDTAFRAKCFERIGKIISGTGVIFVSHDENQIARICDRVLVLERGSVKYLGPTREGLRLYREINEVPVSSQRLHSENFSDVRLDVLTPTVEWGGTLELLLTFDSSDEVRVGLFLVHLFTESTFVAHSDLSESCPRIQKGRNELRIQLDSLQLVEGPCHASISVFSEDRRVTLIHLINEGKFRVSGPRGYGPAIIQSGHISASP